MIPIRFYIYAGIAALIGYLMWREHSLTRKLATAHLETAQANATLAALQAAQAHERKISKDATDDYERRIKELASDALATPVRTVRLCRSPTGYVPAPSATTSGIDETGSPGHPSATGQDPEGSGSTDIGPALYSLADEKDKALAQCLSLQKWVESR